MLHLNELPVMNLAYLDPGMGSMMIQALVGVFAAALIGFRVFWARIRRLFSRKNKDNSSDKQL